MLPMRLDLPRPRTNYGPSRAGEGDYYVVMWIGNGHIAYPGVNAWGRKQSGMNLAEAAQALAIGACFGKGRTEIEALENCQRERAIFAKQKAAA